MVAEGQGKQNFGMTSRKERVAKWDQGSGTTLKAQPTGAHFRQLDHTHQSSTTAQ